MSWGINFGKYNQLGYYCVIIDLTYYLAVAGTEELRTIIEV